MEQLAWQLCEHFGHALQWLGFTESDPKAFEGCPRQSLQQLWALLDDGCASSRNPASKSPGCDASDCHAAPEGEPGGASLGVKHTRLLSTSMSTST
eukprot:3690950-Amphidinium_carterae.2